MTSIVRLMAVRQNRRDLAWLKSALQAAVCLELSTIPALPNREVVAKELRIWWRKDLSYVGRHCKRRDDASWNCLQCSRRRRWSSSLDDRASLPRYPGPLPGGVSPGLRLELTKLTLESIALFMRVEFPAARHNTYQGRSYPTIGDFYAAILQAFRACSGAFRHALSKSRRGHSSKLTDASRSFGSDL